MPVPASSQTAPAAHTPLHPTLTHPAPSSCPVAQPTGVSLSPDAPDDYRMELIIPSDIDGVVRPAILDSPQEVQRGRWAGGGEGARSRPLCQLGMRGRVACGVGVLVEGSSL